MERSIAVILALCAGLAACKPAIPAPQPPTATPTEAGAWTQLAVVAAPANAIPDEQGAARVCLVAEKPVTAQRANGDLVAVWWSMAQDGRTPATTAGGYGALPPRQYPRTLTWAVKRAGVWSAPFTIPSLVGVSSEYDDLQLAAVADGSLALTIAFRSNNGGSAQTLILTQGPLDGAWSFARPLDVGGLREIQIAAVGYNGFALVGEGPDGRPRFARAIPGGWSPAEPLRDLPQRTVKSQGEDVLTGGFRPALAADGNGRVLVAWNDNEFTAQEHGRFAYDISYRLRDPQTDAWSPARRLGPLVLGARPPAVAAAGEGFFIAYADDEVHGVSVANVGRGGFPDPPPEVVARDGKLPSDVALVGRPDGSLMLSWSDYIGDSGNRTARMALGSPRGGWRLLAPLDAYPAVIEASAPEPTVLASTPASGGCPALAELAWRPK